MTWKSFCSCTIWGQREWVIADWLRMKIYGNEVPKRGGEKPEARKSFLMKKSWCCWEIYGVRSLARAGVGMKWNFKSSGNASWKSNFSRRTLLHVIRRWKIFQSVVTKRRESFPRARLAEVDWLVRDYSLIHSTTRFVIVQLEDE